MLVQKLAQRLGHRGDTLVEVTFALVIMSSVIIGATSVAAQAFRLSSTARERTQLVNAAVEQAEGLRSFRDNHLWDQFLTGNGVGIGSFRGVENIALIGCSLPSLVGKNCFSMTVAGNQWVPTNATANISNNAVPPQAIVEIYQPPSGASSQCAVKFEVHYGSPSIASPVWQEGQIAVELVNSRFVGGSYAARCQP